MLSGTKSKGDLFFLRNGAKGSSSSTKTKERRWGIKVASKIPRPGLSQGDPPSDRRGEAPLV